MYASFSLMFPEVTAVVFLAIVAVIVFCWAYVCLKRCPFTTVQSVLFFLNVLLTRLLWRVSIAPRLPLDDTEGAVIVSNHRSSVDPFFVQLVAERPVHWMVTKEAYDSGAFGWFLQTCETIPARRSGIDTAATKLSIRLASRGGLIGMFPEGRINMTDDFMMKVRPGAILIALKAKVNVLPCYVEGSPYRGEMWSPLIMPARVKVKFGRPIDLSDYYGRERENGVLPYLTRFCIREIARLAGHDDFEAELAGRSWKPREDELNELMAAQAKRA